MKTLRLKSFFDDIELATAVSEPQTSPKAVFQIVHGMAEHKERYYPFMEFLSDNGYICVIHDHRGHGESAGDESELGYMDKGGANALVEDVLTVQNWARSQYPGLPVYLFGHSMGSMVVRVFTKRYDAFISKLVVCGCPSNNPGKGVGMLVADIQALFHGPKYRSHLLNDLAFGKYPSLFPGESPLAWLSANKDNVKAYHDDPLCGFVFTVNGFKNLFRIMQECYGAKGWKMANPSLSIMFISGGDDPCRISDRDFNKAVDFMRRRGYKDVSSHLYPGLRHELLLEGKREVWDDVLKFLDR